ncbi:MAG: NAD(P)/FAD-dependent oxidoreductase [Verrucomicrobiae bacterium]|nr:NAD(P)/FAD-dependent oxidoreductase [Verrucomicrobiae bacterium]NNJ43368.1 NAD(P)/FAD-dependent oxidoreductase [Akkermansiaceae bacterium]
MPKDPPWDLIVVGGGAAGFFAAITYAEKAGPGCRVLILEKSPQVLGKVKISGGGRCNVTHACFDPKQLTRYYPRGHKSLIGPFHRWGASDTVDWFCQRGVLLKTEPDGRMFPVTDDSQTIIDCLTRSASSAGVIVHTSTGVPSVIATETSDARFQITTEKGKHLLARSLLLATGGTRLAAGAKLAQSLGHPLVPNVPSLFAFKITDPRINDLPGISLTHTHISVKGTQLTSDGPLLITHHGLSGPAVLKLSAWGARELHNQQYHFTLTINWLPKLDVATILRETRQSWGKRRVCGRAPFESFPKRLWERLCIAAGVEDDGTWSQLDKSTTTRLLTELISGNFQVTGKSLNKDEFVTCGGVQLSDVQLKTMESKIQSGLYFAGEILDIDGVTGGFNFQNAWTTGFLAGTAVST